MTTETTGITAAGATLGTRRSGTEGPEAVRLPPPLLPRDPVRTDQRGLATACLAPSASAHGGDGGKGYRSSIVRLVPTARSSTSRWSIPTTAYNCGSTAATAW